MIRTLQADPAYAKRIATAGYERMAQMDTDEVALVHGHGGPWRGPMESHGGGFYGGRWTGHMKGDGGVIGRVNANES